MEPGERGIEPVELFDVDRISVLRPPSSTSAAVRRGGCARPIIKNHVSLDAQITRKFPPVAPPPPARLPLINMRAREINTGWSKCLRDSGRR